MSIDTTITDYTATQAPDFSDAIDPFDLFETWYADARRTEPNDSNAMALATVGSTGMPNVRIVLLKGLDPVSEGAARGFVFYTNVESAKGEELSAQPAAALLFHWKTLRRQIRIRGVVDQVSSAEADTYFASRPRDARIGAWASTQSRPLANRAALEAAVATQRARFEGKDVPRPAYWSGFRVRPLEFEFWHDRPARLHQRLQFSRAGIEAAWQRGALFP